MESNSIVFLLLVGAIGIILLSANASGDKSMIPQWIKNNAKWWSEGKIGENDYILSLQYLVSQGIIKIPITEVTASTTSLSDDDRAMSFVVRIEEKEELTFDTFSKFNQFGQTTAGEFSTGSTNAPKSSANQQFGTGDTNVPKGLGGPQFQLESLPSKDKKEFYKIVARYINAGAKPEPIDVNIDLVAGDGSVIQTLKYAKCEISAYWAAVNDNKEQYRLGNIEGPEIREFTNFLCQGYSINVP